MRSNNHTFAIMKKFYKTNEGYTVEVISSEDKYRTIKFPDGNTRVVEQSSLSKGRVKNLMHRSVFGVGFLGYGDYKTSINSIKTDCYNVWVNMLLRCYSKKFQEKHPSYKIANVSAEWHNFQNFAKWFHKESNYEAGFELDKDLLVSGNKEYNKEKCIFIPKELNSIINSGKGYYHDKRRNKFVASCSLGGGVSINLGSFLTEKEAFLKYKETKEKYIKQRAEFYKNQITPQVYESLLNFKISG